MQIAHHHESRHGITLRGLARLALVVAVVLPATRFVLAPATAMAAGTTYYVDATAGSDANTGLSPAAPWQSLTRVDATTFAPGDQVLFHTGETWSGQLHPLGSGAAGAPITISSYGGGARPHIDGGSLTTDPADAVFLQDQSYWTINGLEVTNDTGTDNTGDVTAGLHRSGIMVADGGYGFDPNQGLVAGITITGNDVHNVNGCSICSSGDDPHSNGGIEVWADQEVGPASFSGVTITGNTVDHVDREGIVVGDMSNASSAPYQYAFDPTSLSNGVHIANNTVTYTDGDGITNAGTSGSLIEHNVVGHASQLNLPADLTENTAVGLWTAHSLNTTIQYNEVYGTLMEGTDGTAIDNDLGSSYTKIQYNYTHDNQGGFMLMMGGGLGDYPSASDDDVIRDNLSVNDGYGGVKGVFDFSESTPNQVQIDNNTVYIPAGSPANPMYCDLCTTANYGIFTFRNNIVENLGTGSWDYPAASGPTIDHNDFYGNHVPTEPADPFGITADPLLAAVPATAPMGIANVTGYEVAAGSPAIGAGLLMPESGGLDYFGSTRSTTNPPTLGFEEATPASGPPTIVDPGDLAVPQSSDVNVVLDDSTPNLFAGHQYRYTRVTAQPGNVTWRDPGVAGFTSTVFAQSTVDSSLPQFSASPDGVAFTPITMTATAPVATGDGWTMSQVTPSAPLPSGTAYVRATMSSSSPDTPQVGGIILGPQPGTPVSGPTVTQAQGYTGAEPNAQTQCASGVGTPSLGGACFSLTGTLSGATSLSYTIADTTGLPIASQVSFADAAGNAVDAPGYSECAASVLFVPIPQSSSDPVATVVVHVENAVSVVEQCGPPAPETTGQPAGATTGTVTAVFAVGAAPAANLPEVGAAPALIGAGLLGTAAVSWRRGVAETT